MPRDDTDFNRLDRPLSLTAQVEQLLRRAIASGRFAGGKLPTEVDLAEQLGVSRETVRLAAENLQREGLLVKIRRKGTFTQVDRLPDELPATAPTLIGFLSASYPASQGQEEDDTRGISGLMLQGAVEAASAAGNRLVVQRAAHTQLGKAFQQLHQEIPLRGVIFASYGEEKLLKRIASLGLPTVLLDHDLPMPHVHSVRDDSFQGAHDAVQFLAKLGHSRIAYINWRRAELNPWRLQGYRQGLRDAGLRRQMKWELSAELTRAGAKQAVEMVLALSPRPTALYCFNNSLANFVVEELTARGIHVPEQMSVVGGGGESVAGLTCHQVDWHSIGMLAVNVLVKAIAKPDLPPEHHLVPHTIREGMTARKVD